MTRLSRHLAADRMNVRKGTALAWCLLELSRVNFRITAWECTALVAANSGNRPGVRISLS